MSERRSPASHSYLRRKTMYKTSPNWQLIYKQQCISRLNDHRNQSRSRLIDRFRNIDINDDNIREMDTERQSLVDQVMASVWHQYNNGLPSIKDEDLSIFMEEIRQELLTEEMQYWETLGDDRQREELGRLVANQESVFCFFCLKSALDISHPSDFETRLCCPNCGFNFVTQLRLSSHELQHRMDDMVAKHSSICANPSLKFSLINDCSNSGPNNIIVSCDICHKSEAIFRHFQ